MSRDVSGDGGVLVSTTKDGNGTKPQPGHMVFAHYTGSFEDGTVFDSSKSKPHRAEVGFFFCLGEGGVIAGWDVGFASMTIGEHARFTVRYDYGYGEQGMPQSGIPAKATLIFDVELLDAKFMTDAEVHAVNMKVESLRR